MIIKNIHIDNYGKYSARSFGGLAKGVNVIFGPNEHGKTTLLEFVRRMFFGFPRKDLNKNRFEPINGSNPGGRLICTLDSGAELTIERTGWKKGGALKLDSVDSSSRELNELLRAGELFYHNVYAITIEELYSVDSLKGEDIKSRIYGAGLDLGGVSLAQVKKQFKDKAEKIFKPGGSKQRIHELNEQVKSYEQQIKTADENLNYYEEIIAEQKRNDADIESLRDKIKKISGLNEFIDYEALTRKLEKIPNVPPVSQEDIEEYLELSAELKAASGSLAKSKAKQLELREKIKAVNINSALLELGPEVTLLERSSELYSSDSEDAKKQKGQIEKLKKQSAETRRNIASLWREDKIPDKFSFNLEFISRTNEFEREFSDLRQQKISSDILLQQQTQISQAAPPKNVLSLLIIGILDLTMIATGILINSPAVILIAVIICIPTAIAAAQSFNEAASADDKVKTDPFEEKLNELEIRWKDFLRQKFFKDILAPRDLSAGAEIYKNYLKDQSSMAALQQELNDKELRLSNIDETLRKVSTRLDKQSLTTDALANIEIISKIFRQNEKASVEYGNLLSELKKLESSLDSARNEVTSRESALKDLRAKFQAKDLKDLRRMLACGRERKNLNEKLEESGKRLKNIFGLNAEMDAIRSQLENFSHEHAEQKESLEKDLDKLKRRQGELTNEQKNLVSADKLVVLHNEHERCIQQIRNCALQWGKYKAAELLIKRAVNKYEQERQPEVISQATEIFKRLTNGLYVNIRKPAESDDLLLVGVNGATRKVLELSRGTREQLYLAMRLGLIEQYEEKTESLPLIFDDILVNFDKTRLKSAVETIFKFAGKRQVIILTCHENIHSLLLKYGANDISLTK